VASIALDDPGHAPQYRVLRASPRSPPSGMRREAASPPFGPRAPARRGERPAGRRTLRACTRHPSGAQAGARRPPARAKPPDPRGALPIRARDHVRGAQPRGPLRGAALARSQASLRRGGRRPRGAGGLRPPAPLPLLPSPWGSSFESAGVPMQGAPPLRCGVRREGARGGGSKSQPAMAAVVAVTVSDGSEPIHPTDYIQDYAPSAIPTGRSS
jgi:hypothetical protein